MRRFSKRKLPNKPISFTDVVLCGDGSLDSREMARHVSNHTVRTYSELQTVSLLLSRRCELAFSGRVEQSVGCVRDSTTTSDSERNRPLTWKSDTKAYPAILSKSSQTAKIIVQNSRS